MTHNHSNKDAFGAPKDKQLSKAAQEALDRREKQRIERELRDLRWLDFRAVMGDEIQNVSIGK